MKTTTKSRASRVKLVDVLEAVEQNARCARQLITGEKTRGEVPVTPATIKQILLDTSKALSSSYCQLRRYAEEMP